MKALNDSQRQPGTGASRLRGGQCHPHHTRGTFRGVSVSPCPEVLPHMDMYHYGEEDMVENSACDFASLGNVLPTLQPLPTGQLPNCSEPVKAF